VLCISCSHPRRDSEEIEALRQDAARLYQAGQLEASIPVLERLVEESKVEFGNRSSEVARALHDLGLVYTTLGRSREAIEIYARALSLLESALGTAHPGITSTLVSLGNLYRSSGDLERARPLLERALAIREDAFGSNDLRVAHVLNNLGELHLASGDLDAAEPLFRRCAAIRSEISGDAHPSVAIPLSNLSAVHGARGGFENAAKHLQRALLIWEPARGPAHPSTIEMRNLLAGLRHSEGKYQLAESLLDRSLEAQQNAPAGPLLSDTLNRLAGVYIATGRYALAEPLLHRSLRIQQATSGPESRDAALILNNMGEIHRLSGRYPEAERWYEQALEISKKDAANGSVVTAHALNGLGMTANVQGDRKRATELMLQSLEIFESIHGPEHPDVAAALVNLFGVYYAQGELDRAEKAVLRSLAILEQEGLARDPRTSAALANLAIIARSRGDSSRAKELLARSLSMLEGVDGADPRHVVAVLNNLAGLEREIGGDPEPLLRRSLALIEGISEHVHPMASRVLTNLTMVRWLKGDLNDAATLASRTLEVDDRLLALLLPALPEELARGYMHQVRAQSSWALSLLAEHPSDAELLRATFAAVLRRKGRVLDEAARATSRLRRDPTPESQKLLDDLFEKRTQLANLVLSGSRDEPLENHQRLVAQLWEEADEAERLAHKAAGATSAGRPISIDDVQRGIPDDAALIELVAYRHARPSLDDEQWGSERLAAFVLRRQGAPKWVDLGEAAPVSDAVAEFRDALRPGVLSLARPHRAGAELFEAVVAPIRPHLEGVTQLLIAPDGELQLVPFAALRTPSNRYLIEEFTLTYLTSGRDLLDLGKGSEGVGKALVIGAPDYDARPPKRLAAAPNGVLALRSSDLGDVRWEALPATKEEARALAKLLGVAPVTGSSAREEVLKQAIRPSVLHIATHGFFLPDLPQPPAKVRGTSGRMVGIGTTSPVPPPPTDEHPMLRSGLALAGANRRDDRSEDGILTAFEMASLDLTGTELVVLSACDTGIGTVANGEVVFGLRRAIVLAGARSQVTTLWKVDDATTGWFMKSFYERLGRGTGRSQALREVQLSLIEDPDRRHPFFWASFIPVGAWGPVALPLGATGR
jgi:CHAT domain-containing protein/Tfp pilus assembly protein PilF